MKRIVLILMTLLFLSCTKKVEKEKRFEPTILLKEINKNERTKNIIWDFRLTNIKINRGEKQSKEYEVFRDELTEEELIQITACEIPLLRCIAFKALVERDYVHIRKILNEHKNDNDIVEEYYCDILLSRPVKSFMLSQLSPFSSSKFKFSKKEFTELQSEFYK